jgi:hypothetical protein
VRLCGLVGDAYVMHEGTHPRSAPGGARAARRARAARACARNGDAGPLGWQCRSGRPVMANKKGGGEAV